MTREEVFKEVDEIKKVADAGLTLNQHELTALLRRTISVLWVVAQMADESRYLGTESKTETQS